MPCEAGLSRASIPPDLYVREQGRQHHLAGVKPSSQPCSAGAAEPDVLVRALRGVYSVDRERTGGHVAPEVVATNQSGGRVCIRRGARETHCVVAREVPVSPPPGAG